MLSRKPWVLVFSALALGALVASRAAGLGARETEARSVSGFENVIFATSGTLAITQGEQEGLQITARAADLADIVTEVRDGALVIRWRDREPVFVVRPPRFHLTMRKIAGLETRSSGSIAAGNLRAGSLRVRISSSGDVSIGSLAADSLDVRLSSSGSFHAAGRVRQQDIVLSSSGGCLAGNLACETATVLASSSGSATLRVRDRLQASVTSSGSVLYYGNPEVIPNVTSSGGLVRLGG